MPEEVQKENVPQPIKDIINAIKKAKSFGPFGKSKDSEAKSLVQCFKVCNINFHYDIIAGARAAANEEEKKTQVKFM